MLFDLIKVPVVLLFDGMNLSLIAQGLKLPNY